MYAYQSGTYNDEIQTWHTRKELLESTPLFEHQACDESLMQISQKSQPNKHFDPITTIRSAGTRTTLLESTPYLNIRLDESLMQISQKSQPNKGFAAITTIRSAGSRSNPLESLGIETKRGEMGGRLTRMSDSCSMITAASVSWDRAARPRSGPTSPYKCVIRSMG